MDLLITERKGAVVLLTINRPQGLNALNREVMLALSDKLSELEEDGSLRALILTGAGDKAFVAGADIGEMAELDRSGAEIFARFGNRLMRQITRFPVPVIAAINGYALGGGFELALACDLRLASVKARLAFPETGLGITPGFGGTQRLARLAGSMVALDLIMTGRWIKAEEAQRLGLVMEVTEEADLLPRAWALAEILAQKAPVAIREAKRAIRMGLDLPLDEGLVVEETGFGRCFETEDQKRAMKAYLNKEDSPEFEGK